MAAAWTIAAPAAAGTTGILTGTVRDTETRQPVAEVKVYLAQADNYAVALRGSASLNILLVGKGDLFLERALSLSAGEGRLAG